jgi:nicotinamidase-related amidase
MRASDAEGQWQTYYRRWKSVLAENNDQAVFDLIAPLGDFVPPGRIVDKYTYSAFGTPVFAQILGELGARTLVISGVETDVCVMATALTAVDLGYRVVIAADAVASSSPAGHDAALRSIYPRYDHQIEIADTETLIREWKS